MRFSKWGGRSEDEGVDKVRTEKLVDVKQLDGA